jgi:carbamoyl-phosphate synthase small subunit
MSERAWALPAVLALEDGTLFRGEGMGAPGTVTGEVCFNTSMTGYQEVLTDPSYHGQIVAMTAPHIGNTGVNDFDDQSRRPFVNGFVVRDASEWRSSWRATGGFDDYLADRSVVGISGVDTRKLTRHLRTRGAMRGALSTEHAGADDVVDIARASPGLVGRDLASEVSTPVPYTWTAENVPGLVMAPPGAELGADLRSPARIAAFDFGLKRNILDRLVASGCEVTVLPAHRAAHDVLAGDYDGVFLSNGPGDPEPVEYAIRTVRSLLGRIPVFGICLGHQIIGLALGARTYKLPFGHRGGNHPVKRVDHPRVEITCQNHGFSVDESSLANTPARLSHVNLNDGTVEGLEVPGVAFSVQYHPESAPGPHDSRYLFENFKELIARFEPVELDRLEAAHL